MKRKILLPLLIILSASFLFACGKKDNKTIKDAKCEDILQEIKDNTDLSLCDTTTVYGDEDYSNYFDTLYDSEIEDISDGVFAYASSAYADEVTIVKVSDGDTKYFKSRLEKRIEKRKNDFNGYKPEEVEKLDSARIAVEGDYVIMAVSDNAARIIDIFKDFMEE